MPSYDANGNILAWTDGSGTVVQRMDYDPFGNTVMVEKLAPASTTKLPSIGFSTKYQDEETGLYYYGYRYYDPVTGRSPSRDPIEEEGGVNLYGFVGNDGMNRFDRLGLQTNWAWHANMPLYPSAPEPPASVLAQRDINSYSKAFSGTLVGEVAGINFALAKLEGRVSQARYIHCGILALGYATANPSAAALDSSGTKKLYIRPSAAKSLILHELVHAHNDATGMAIANSLMGEGMAYLLASNMDMLDIYLVKLEKAITEGVEEDVMRNAVAWSYFWESRETWSSTGWDDTVVSGTIFPKSSSDFTNLKVSLRINFSCQPLADAFNRILELRDGCIRFQRNSLALEIDGNHKLSYDANIKIGVEY
ncbi:RHS repeat-associated protein [Haloferula luteola]|uniref:RHS repeat-associated protein n=1 Tax=Haloferula luteola TaxID=595692 RepID=A0A840VEN1_9BACT|nr:RHS repeat-associated protein [Haloferula luteola]